MKTDEENPETIETAGEVVETIEREMWERITNKGKVANVYNRQANNGVASADTRRNNNTKN